MATASANPSPSDSRRVAIGLPTTALIAVGVAIYVSGYLLSTDVFHGRLGATHYRVRLFRSEWHQRIFSPLLTAEQWLRPPDPEFSGEVQSGASLPPPDDEKR